MVNDKKVSLLSYRITVSTCSLAFFLLGLTSFMGYEDLTFKVRAIAAITLIVALTVAVSLATLTNDILASVIVLFIPFLAFPYMIGLSLVIAKGTLWGSFFIVLSLGVLMLGLCKKTCNKQTI